MNNIKISRKDVLNIFIVAFITAFGANLGLSISHRVAQTVNMFALW